MIIDQSAEDGSPMNPGSAQVTNMWSEGVAAGADEHLAGDVVRLGRAQQVGGAGGFFDGAGASEWDRLVEAGGDVVAVTFDPDALEIF
jgi:hypothetical protein